MKTVLTILASVSIFASTVSARPECETPRRLVGYTHCGTPIYATYEMVGRSRCGEPIFQWVTHYPREESFGHSYRDHDDDHHGWDRDHGHHDDHHHHSHR
jgi:hypothetical protein